MPGEFLDKRVDNVLSCCRQMQSTYVPEDTVRDLRVILDLRWGDRHACPSPVVSQVRLCGSAVIFWLIGRDLQCPPI